MTSHLRCQANVDYRDAMMETSLAALHDELLKSSGKDAENANRLGAEGVLGDWQVNLSQCERKHYIIYKSIWFQKYGILPENDQRAAFLVSQEPESHCSMSDAHGAMPTFTHTSARIMRLIVGL